MFDEPEVAQGGTALRTTRAGEQLGSRVDKQIDHRS
jgi:hypothetical protein